MLLDTDATGGVSLPFMLGFSLFRDAANNCGEDPAGRCLASSRSRVHGKRRLQVLLLAVSYGLKTIHGRRLSILNLDKRSSSMSTRKSQWERSPKPLKSDVLDFGSLLQPRCLYVFAARRPFAAECSTERPCGQ